eukprot:NODE_181_length_13917_cov_0.838110.p12 type:complete len:165 gc:universal NODE_181_length_13917_cov_0.838110:3966-3472(-)
MLNLIILKLRPRSPLKKLMISQRKKNRKSRHYNHFLKKKIFLWNRHCIISQKYSKNSMRLSNRRLFQVIVEESLLVHLSIQQKFSNHNQQVWLKPLLSKTKAKKEPRCFPAQKLSDESLIYKLQLEARCQKHRELRIREEHREMQPQKYKSNTQSRLTMIFSDF